MDVLLCCDLLCFIFSELVDGSVSNNLLVDGSTVTLLPRAETGLIVSIKHNLYKPTVGRREGHHTSPLFGRWIPPLVANISSLTVAFRMICASSMQISKFELAKRDVK